jgi:sugar/nucleoside kinase (ribokinase family)
LHFLTLQQVFAINLSAPYISKDKQLDEIIYSCDFVFGNQTEAEAFGLARDWKEVCTLTNIFEFDNKLIIVFS